MATGTSPGWLWSPPTPRTGPTGRRILRIGIDELVSLLCGPLGGVDLVALDSVSDAEADVLDGSASLTRQRFLDYLLGPRNSGGLGKSLASLTPGDPERRDP